MIIYNKNEILGQWSDENMRFIFLSDNSMYFYMINNFKILFEGTYSIFENYINIKYLANKNEMSQTYKISELKNDLTLIDLSENIGLKVILKKTFFEIDLIKKLNFDELTGLTIGELKAELNITTFHFNTAKDKQRKDTNFFRHWENKDRIAILIKKDLANKIKVDKDMLLTIEKTIRKGELGFYNNLQITEYDDTEYTNYDLREVYDDYNFNNIHNDYLGFK